jgi:hypothetical protein
MRSLSSLSHCCRCTNSWEGTCCAPVLLLSTHVCLFCLSSYDAFCSVDRWTSSWVEHTQGPVRCLDVMLLMLLVLLLLLCQQVDQQLGGAQVAVRQRCSRIHSAYATCVAVAAAVAAPYRWTSSWVEHTLWDFVSCPRVAGWLCCCCCCCCCCDQVDKQLGGAHASDLVRCS